MTIPLTPDQFATLKAKILATPTAAVTQGSDLSANVITSDIEFTYSYDGSADLTINVLNRRSFLARHASDSTIDAHIQDMVRKALA